MIPGHQPLVVLHDHLDGGVRPTTLIELAAAAGVAVSADDHVRDLVVAATQTASALRRISREAVEDLAADGVVYAELRFAPLNHITGGITANEVMAAVHAGLDDADGETCTTNLIVSAMRHLPESVSCEAAEIAVRWMGERVVGLDLAGGVVGNPAADHARAFAIAAEAGLGRTINAGETDGVAQVRSALDHCRPDRIGHGRRLIEDCDVVDGRIVALGPTAAEVRDAGIPLEICITSNDCLGPAVIDHPVRLLFDAGFRVTLNPDDRAVTTTTTHRFSDVELAACVERAAAAAFLPIEDRDALVGLVSDGWNSRPARLVHLAERDRWESARSRGSYLPAEWDRDGFIHLSALHQLLTPANRFYRGRDDLVALVVDAHLLGSAVVWEAGTGTVERFPHLYAALTPEAVLGEYPLSPEPDGGFLLPPMLVRAARSPVEG